MTPTVCREVDNRAQYVVVRDLYVEIAVLRGAVRALRERVRELEALVGRKKVKA